MTRDELRMEIAARIAGADIEWAAALYNDMKDKGNRSSELMARREYEKLPWWKRIFKRNP